MDRYPQRENARFGSKREPVASTISTPATTAPLESARQRRALRGPKRWRTAIGSRVRDSWATPVVRTTRKRKPAKGKPANPRYNDGRTYTMAVGGSCAPKYVPGRG